MSKTVLIAHHDAEVRAHFVAAFAGAEHRCVTAALAEEATRAAADADVRVSLALVDVGLAADAAAFVRQVREGADPETPIVVFASTVAGADQVPRLAGLGVAGFINDHAAGPQILPALAPHLFPDNFNRRSSPRVSLGVPVSYRAGRTIAGAVTLDVGKGGLAVRTMTPLPTGTALQIKFRLPGSGADLEATARVAWSDRKVGMGVQFTRMAPADQATVDAFVDANLTEG